MRKSFIFCLAVLLAVGAHAQESGDAWGKIAPYFSPPEKFAGDFGDYESPLLFPDEDGHIASQPQQWQRRRTDIRREWMKLMGEWPPLLEDQQLEIIESEPRENYIQHRVRFRWLPEPAEPTEGYLLVPMDREEGEKLPAVITVYYEPETAAGMGKENRDFAYQLVKRGFVALSIGTKHTSDAKTYSLHWPSLDDARVEPLSMLAYAAANAWHALSLRAEVDAERIGIVGHSYGGKWAMFASCLFDKFACAAWSDPGIMFDDTRPGINYWEPWYLGYHPRPWRKRGLITAENPAHGTYLKLRADGHDLHEVHALMAPRPFLVSGGAEDTPERWRALNHSIAVNKLLGYENRVAMTNRPDHSPNPESNAAIYAFFEWFLKPETE